MAKPTPSEGNTLPQRHLYVSSFFLLQYLHTLRLLNKFQITFELASLEVAGKPMLRQPNNTDRLSISILAGLRETLKHIEGYSLNVPAMVLYYRFIFFQLYPSSIERFFNCLKNYTVSKNDGTRFINTHTGRHLLCYTQQIGTFGPVLLIMHVNVSATYIYISTIKTAL